MGFKPLSEDGFYGWINVIAASIFMFTTTIMLHTFSLFLPEWIKEFGWKYEYVSYALTINMIVMSFANPFVGFFIGKYGSRISIIIGSFITIIGIYNLANIHSLLHLYIANGVIVGIGITLGGVLAITTLINNWFSKKRSLSLSITMAAMSLAGIIMAPIVRWMITHVGWRETYMTIIPVYFVFALLIPGIFLRNTPQELGQVPDGQAGSEPIEKDKGITKETDNLKFYRTPVDFTVSETFKTRTMWLFMVFQVLNWITMGAIMAHGYAFLDDIGVPPMTGSLVIGYIGATMVVGQMLVGFMGLRFNMQKLVLLGCVGIIVSYILMGFADRSIIIVFTYGTFAGIGMGINLVALMNLIPNYFGVTHFPRIAGLTMPVATLIGSAGAPICGYIRDETGSYILFWEISAVLMTIGLICLYFAKPPVHPSLKNEEGAS